MKLPVKDRATIPWMTKREIPAIKAVLSAWRAKRNDRAFAQQARDTAALIADCNTHSRSAADTAAWLCEKLVAIDERLRKETENAKAEA
jgi:hypothetical protein